MGKSAKTVFACIVIAVFVAAGLVAYKYYSPASPSFETGKAVRQQVGKAGGAETVQETLKIGAILPLSGNLSFLGTPGKNAIELFESLHPGSKVDIRLYDSKADPKTAISAFRLAYDFDGARFFITTLTGVSLGVKPVAAGRGAFQACIAIYPGLSAGSPLAFQTCYNAVEEARCLVDYIRERGIEKLFIFASRDAVTEVELAKYILPYLKKSGVTVVSDQFDVGSKDFRPLIAKFKASGALDALLLGYGSDFVGILKELANQKLIAKVRLIGGIGYLELPNYVGYELVKNSVFVSPEFLAEKSGNDSYMRFRAKYRKAFNSYPTYDAAYTYDTVSALARAAEAVKTVTPVKVAEFLRSNKLPGVTGPIEFNDSGELKVQVVMARYDRNMEITKASE